VGLAYAIGETHRRYTNFVNARGRWSGHLFQKRYGSVVMDERHLIAGVGNPRNPVTSSVTGLRRSSVSDVVFFD
jgi:hypothetical protein